MTNAEIERLAILLEEMGEAQQMIGKILREGYKAFDPTDPLYPGNLHKEVLERELGHAIAAIVVMERAGDIEIENVLKHEHEKSRTIGQWLRFQKTTRPQ